MKDEATVFIRIALYIATGRLVAEIKGRTESLLDYIRDNVPQNRERSIALTNYEQAAMWAVKANFT